MSKAKTPRPIKPQRPSIRELISDEVKAGLSVNEIAIRHGMNERTVANVAVFVRGNRKPRKRHWTANYMTRQAAKNLARTRSRALADRAYHRWSSAERLRLAALYKSGLTSTKIAKEMGRSLSSIGNAIRRYLDDALEELAP